MNTCTADASASEPEATASTSRGSSENKAELMESAHLLCSLFDNKPKNDNLTTALKASSTSTSTSTTSTSISAISSETKTNARKCMLSGDVLPWIINCLVRGCTHSPLLQKPPRDLLLSIPPHLQRQLVGAPALTYQVSARRNEGHCSDWCGAYGIRSFR